MGLPLIVGNYGNPGDTSAASIQQSLAIVGAYVTVWLKYCITQIKRAIISAGAAIITHAYIQIAHLT